MFNVPSLDLDCLQEVSNSPIRCSMLAGLGDPLLSYNLVDQSSEAVQK